VSEKEVFSAHPLPDRAVWPAMLNLLVRTQTLEQLGWSPVLIASAMEGNTYWILPVAMTVRIHASPKRNRGRGTVDVAVVRDAPIGRQTVRVECVAVPVFGEVGDCPRCSCWVGGSGRGKGIGIGSHVAALGDANALPVAKRAAKLGNGSATGTGRHDDVAGIVADAVMVVGELRGSGDTDGVVGVAVMQRQSDGSLGRAVCFEWIAQRGACSSERYTGHVGNVVLPIIMLIRSWSGCAGIVSS
jgi:hypothetical protein